MELNTEEQAILRGEQGIAAQEALTYQINVGEFFEARRFVPISNAHMMGDIEVLGDSGLNYLKCTADKHARCRVPTTTNARCIDFDFVDRLGQDRHEAQKEKKVIQFLRGMNVMT